MKIFIIPTSTAEHLIRGIKNRSKNFEVVFPNLNKDGKRHFPDGEIYMKILKAGKLRNKRVIVLHSGAPKPNEGLVELELILQILRDNNIKPEVFFTYFPYGMQDKIFENGETNIAENLIEKLVNYYGVKKIYIIDPHFGGKKWTEKYSIISISAIPLLIKKVKEDFGQNILFLSPDTGGERRTGVKGIKKQRKDSYTVEIKSSKDFKRLIEGKLIGVVDDILETGGTLDKFYTECKKLGAKKLIVLVTHGTLYSGISRIQKKYSKLYLTNTINTKEANIDITNLILKTISHI